MVSVFLKFEAQGSFAQILYWAVFYDEKPICGYGITVTEVFLSLTLLPGNILKKIVEKKTFVHLL